MAFTESETITVTTAADGTGSGTFRPRRGAIVRIVYTKVDYDAGVDFAITTGDDAVGVWTESNVDSSKTVHPTLLDDDQVGAARATVSPIYLANERVTVAITNGGNVTSGTFKLVTR